MAQMKLMVVSMVLMATTMTATMKMTTITEMRTSAAAAAAAVAPTNLCDASGSSESIDSANPRSTHNVTVGSRSRKMAKDFGEKAPTDLFESPERGGAELSGDSENLKKIYIFTNDVEPTKPFRRHRLADTRGEEAGTYSSFVADVERLLKQEVQRSCAKEVEVEFRREEYREKQLPLHPCGKKFRPPHPTTHFSPCRDALGMQNLADLTARDKF
eukprot:764172-Hanusia_phi.AAC.2